MHFSEPYRCYWSLSNLAVLKIATLYKSVNGKSWLISVYFWKTAWNIEMDWVIKNRQKFEITFRSTSLLKPGAETLSQSRSKAFLGAISGLSSTTSKAGKRKGWWGILFSSPFLSFLKAFDKVFHLDFGVCWLWGSWRNPPFVFGCIG